MVLACLFLAWLFLPTKPDPVSIQPTDGLVDQVATVKDSLQVQAGETARRLKSGEWAVVKDSLTTEPIENLEGFDHIGDATKKVEVKKEIVIFSIDGCKPCKDWVAIEQPKFQKAGWKVVKSDDPMTGPWPHFMIETSGKKIEHRSYLLFDKIDEVAK